MTRKELLQSLVGKPVCILFYMGTFIDIRADNILKPDYVITAVSDEVIEAEHLTKDERHFLSTQYVRQIVVDK